MFAVGPRLIVTSSVRFFRIKVGGRVAPRLPYLLYILSQVPLVYTLCYASRIPSHGRVAY